MIRRLELEDRDYFFELIEDLNRSDDLGYSVTPDWYDYVVSQEEGIFGSFIRVGSGFKLVGIGTCMINKEQGISSIINIGIREIYRHRGYGRELYKKIFTYAVENEVRYLEAYIDEGNKEAYDFLKGLGFSERAYSWNMGLDIETLNTKVNFESNLDLELIFRPIELSDYRGYLDLIEDVFGDKLGRDFLNETLLDESVKIYAIERDGKIVGATTVQSKEESAYIYDIGVDRDYRGRGYGSYMILKVAGEIFGKGLGYVSLMVQGENESALRLYRKLGFKKTSTMVVMGKDLN